MAGVTIKVEDREVQVGLGDLRAGVADIPALLRIAGNLMRGSIARTFRDEGSPAGSWPRLALSTMKKKGYTTGHKLLILSGRLFGSIGYAVNGNQLTIGINVVYAQVHQYGSADRSGGSIGAQAKIAGRGVSVSAYDAFRVYKRYVKEKRVGKDGRGRTVRVRADKTVETHVGGHTRHQNIPARPFLVFRPEDPSRIALGMQAYLRGHAARIGKVGGVNP